MKQQGSMLSRSFHEPTREIHQYPSGMSALRNIRLLIAFDGTAYNGWQRQKDTATIQGEIENRLIAMTGEQIMLHGAGRTDAGVHAEGMVANFHTASQIHPLGYFNGLNSMLPPEIRILRADEADPAFHSRFSARGKHYRYRLHTGPVLMPQHRLYCLHHRSAIDTSAIRDCLALIRGTHDFASFENSGSRDKSILDGRGSVRTIFTADLHQSGAHDYTFTFIGDGFLRQMVRNLLGTLLEVGRGKRSVNGFHQALKARSRAAAGPTAPARGLTLKEVLY
jgi:tRNA pseudouridine38-40 synthase